MIASIKHSKNRRTNILQKKTSPKCKQIEKSQIQTHEKQHKGQSNIKMGSENLTHENKHKGQTKFSSHVNIQQ